MNNVIHNNQNIQGEVSAGDAIVDEAQKRATINNLNLAESENKKVNRDDFRLDASKLGDFGSELSAVNGTLVINTKSEGLINSLNLAQEHADDLRSAITLIFDRSHRKFIVPHNPSKMHVNLQTSHHILCLTTKGPIWVCSILFSPSAIHIQSPVISCDFGGSVDPNVVEDLDPEKQIDHVTAKWNGGLLTNWHLTGVRDASEHFVSKAKCVKSADEIIKNAGTPSPAISWPHQLFTANFTSENSKNLVELTKGLPIGSSYPEGRAAGQIKTTYKSTDGAKLLAKIDEKLENRLHLYDLRSCPGFEENGMLFSVSAFLTLKSELDKENLQAPHLSFFDETSISCQQYVRLTRQEVEHIPENSGMLLQIVLAQLAQPPIKEKVPVLVVLNEKNTPFLSMSW